jgi:hypothetical protein
MPKGRPNFVLMQLAGNLMRHTGEELTAAARLAMTARSAVPAYPRALARLPGDHVGTHRIDHSGHLMSRYAQVFRNRVSQSIVEVRRGKPRDTRLAYRGHPIQTISNIASQNGRSTVPAR